MSARFRRWLTRNDQKEGRDDLIFLYNPVTKEQYTVAAPTRTHVHCGFYYHSPTKEYRILLYQLVGVVQFLVLGLQTQVMRVLKLQQDMGDPDVAASSYYYHPDPSTPPVISNGSLHWIASEKNENPLCLHTILCFGMESEEFRLMPHPPLSHACSPSGRRQQHRHYMNLLEMDGGILCLCDGYYSGMNYSSRPILEIYVMEDYKKWTWVRRYRVDLGNYIQDGCPYGSYYKALQILQGDQLLLHYYPDVFHEIFYRKMDFKRHLQLYDCPDEYALYSLNQQHEDGQLASSSSSSTTGMVRKSSKKNKKNKRHRFQVIDGYPGDELVGRLRRMIITSERKKRPYDVVKGNMVVHTPSLASFQHNTISTAPAGTSTFFSIRTNNSLKN